MLGLNAGGTSTARSSPVKRRRNANTANSVANAQKANTPNGPNRTLVAKRRRTNGATTRAPRAVTPLAVGSLVYSESPAQFDPRYVYGSDIYMVLERKADARGPYVVAQQMRSMGVPVNDNVMRNVTEYEHAHVVDLVPLGIKTNGSRFKLRADVSERGVWRDDRPTRAMVRYRVLPYGKRIRHIVFASLKKKRRTSNANNNTINDNGSNNVRIAATLNRLRKRGAARIIEEHIVRKKRALKDPLVNAAIRSSVKVYVDAHGSILPGTESFKVPSGVCLVFLTTPGGLFYSSPINKLRMTNENARRTILGATTDMYTAAYFEGDEVSEHELVFDKSSDIVWVGLPNGNARKANALFLNWKTIRDPNTYNEDSRSLSATVAHMARYGTKTQPIVIFLGICRDISNGRNTNVHANRNSAARRRIAGPHYSLPSNHSERVMRGAKPTLHRFYRTKKASETRMFVNWMRNAGLVSEKFEKA
jgi:hypothetical protein